MTLICGFSSEPLRYFTRDSFFAPVPRGGRWAGQLGEVNRAKGALVARLTLTCGKNRSSPCRHRMTRDKHNSCRTCRVKWLPGHPGVLCRICVFESFSRSLCTTRLSPGQASCPSWFGSV